LVKKGIPTEVQDLYKSLQQELIWTHAKWKTYRQLFAVDQKRIEILNASAPFFFRVVQQTLFEDTLLSISRLTDPPRTMGKENLSLPLLVERLKIHAPEDLIDQLEHDIDEIDMRCTAFRDWRNRRLAHSDLDTSLKVTNDPLPGVSHEDIESALGAIRELMNHVSFHYEDSETLYAEFKSWSGSDRLINLVQQAIALEQAERDEVQAEMQALRDRDESA